MCPVLVNEPDNRVELALNLDFYPRFQVLLAAQDFSGSYWVDLKDSPDGCLIVSIRPMAAHSDVSLVGYEFFNYLLSLVKAR